MNNKQGFNWGHISINVSDLDASIAFYEKLGFHTFLPGIPYLGLSASLPATPMSDSVCAAIGVPVGTTGRACIMQLGDGFPMLDLTELHTHSPRPPLQTPDRGVVRICLSSEDLARDVAKLKDQGVEFLSDVTSGHSDLADIALCRDPDGSLIELIQIYLERWQPLLV